MEDEIKKLVSINSWFVALQAVTLFAFLGGAALLYTDFQTLKQSVAAVAASGAPPSPQDVANWKEYIRTHNPTEGKVGSEIVIEEFTDFQCPFCKSFNDTLRSQLLAEYGDRIVLVFKHYPLEAVHPQAKSAALAAQCALREDKFSQIRDIFFASPERLSAEFYLEAGRALGLSSEYTNCVTEGKTLAEVEQDMRDATSAGIRGTPTFLVNGKVLQGVGSYAQFESIIEQTILGLP